MKITKINIAIFLLICYVVCFIYILVTRKEPEKFISHFTDNNINEQKMYSSLPSDMQTQYLSMNPADKLSFYNNWITKNLS